MARKVETIVTLTDDLDGKEADRTVTFTIDGQSYEIDLSSENAAALNETLSPYVKAGRTVKQGRGRRSGNGTAKRSNMAEIRAWARANGHNVAEKGRIPSQVLQAYESAHGVR